MTKEQRAAKWDSEFIPCKSHTERRCNRAIYVNRRQNSCSGCAHRRTTDGGKQKAYLNKDKTPSGKARLSRYLKSEKGKAVSARYAGSEKGHITRTWYIERKLHG